MTGIRISEIFGPTVQGEGLLIGKPTVFVRTGGCDFRCSWCDTLYAVLPEYRHDWVPMTPEEILAEIARLAGGAPILVTLSGGNPAIQPLGELIAAGRNNGYTFAMETQGSVFAPWFAALDWLVLSPKPPSSGMATDWAPRSMRRSASERPGTVSRWSCSTMPTTPMRGRSPPATGDAAGPPDRQSHAARSRRRWRHRSAGLLARFRWLVDRVAERPLVRGDGAAAAPRAGLGQRARRRGLAAGQQTVVIDVDDIGDAVDDRSRRLPVSGIPRPPDRADLAVTGGRDDLPRLVRRDRSRGSAGSGVSGTAAIDERRRRPQRNTSQR